MAAPLIASSDVSINSFEITPFVAERELSLHAALLDPIVLTA
jgi:hypothetical protein